MLKHVEAGDIVIYPTPLGIPKALVFQDHSHDCHAETQPRPKGRHLPRGFMMSDDV